MQVRTIRPEEIEDESFRIIEQEFFEQTGKRKEMYSPEEFAILQRVIHATGDFSFAETLRFHPQAIEQGLAAIRGGKNIYTDVGMVAVGIGGKLTASFGGRVICKVGEAEVGRLAKESGRTRSETALAMAKDENIGVVAIGNAPTALLTLMELVRNGQFVPDLVIGAPVGFVNAAESKELLVAMNIPSIAVLGRRGGSPVAAAIVNALLKLA